MFSFLADIQLASVNRYNIQIQTFLYFELYFFNIKFFVISFNGELLLYLPIR